MKSPNIYRNGLRAGAALKVEILSLSASAEAQVLGECQLDLECCINTQKTVLFWNDQDLFEDDVDKEHVVHNEIADELEEEFVEDRISRK